MDTTETYIKMSKGAWGICWRPTVNFSEVNPKTFLITNRGNHSFVITSEGSWYYRDFQGLVELKTQDQLQEMVKDVFPDGVWKPFDVFKNFWYWFAKWDNWGEEPNLYFDVPCLAQSMEQLWLAFVMKEKYSRQWLTDSQEWVKI